MLNNFLSMTLKRIKVNYKTAPYEIIILIWIVVFGSIPMIGIAILNYTQGKYILSILEFSIGIAGSITILIFILLKPIYSFAINFYLTIIFILFQIVFYLPTFHNTGLLWLYSYPLVPFFLKKTKTASVWSLCFMGLLLSGKFLADHLNYKLPHSNIFLSFFFITFSLVIIFLILYTHQRGLKDNEIKEYIYEIRDLNKKLIEKTEVDFLTKIFNRRKIIDILNYENIKLYRIQSALTVLILDIDHFKKLNDTYGHLFGDEVLVNTTKTIKDSLRDTVDSFGRIGGEEFLVVLPATDLAGAKIVADRILKNVREQDYFPKTSKDIVNVTISIGIYLTKEMEDIDLFIQRADTALYEAKETGRNKYVVFNKNLEY